MRSIRATALLLALVALTPAAARAQANRPFTDAWFWGAKVGALSFSTTHIENGFAPLVGAEWLITRSRGALYVSLDRSFFSEQSSFSDPGSTSGSSVVDVKDLTRLSFALMAFPKVDKALRPYAGVGLALSFIQESSLTNGGSEVVLDDQSSVASFQLIGGVQKELRSLSLFGQIVMLPYSSDAFLLNGRAAFSLEAGIRWNVGNAIDRIR
jgi:opacity protein-like surface antigen